MFTPISRPARSGTVSTDPAGVSSTHGRRSNGVLQEGFAQNTHYQAYVLVVFARSLVHKHAPGFAWCAAICLPRSRAVLEQHQKQSQHASVISFSKSFHSVEVAA